MGDIGYDDASADGGPPRGPGGNLPLEPDVFVGRAAELDELSRALAASRLVTVTGPGGVGKSRLAARVAARCAPRDGVWRVEPAALGDAEFVDHVVVESLGLTDHTTRLPRETLLGHLSERRLLLVLDGFEHLVDACADLVADLLRRAPGLRVLAVGRRALSVAGSGWYRWLRSARTRRSGCRRCVRGSMRWAPGTRGRCGSCAGVSTASRSRSSRPPGGWAAGRLGGWAAGRLGALSPGKALQRLGDRFRLLTDGGRGAHAAARRLAHP
ncbi:AAA family ATPase [Streptomyces pratens]|uniref:AAA family ATPase n=1 Tax=Streptomyces pratens TaxID=887456 RepID=A0ABW1M2S6_9ACTN